MTKETQADFGLTGYRVGEVHPSAENGDVFAPKSAGDVSAWAIRAGGRGIIFSGPVQNMKPLGLPSDPLARKQTPLFSGVLKYFPRALIAVAQCSFAGNEQHHPGTPLHWDKSKSTDHEDCLLRHLMDDLLGVKMDGSTPHLAKVAWRALALLETRLEKEQGAWAP